MTTKNSFFPALVWENSPLSKALGTIEDAKKKLLEFVIKLELFWIQNRHAMCYFKPNYMKKNGLEMAKNQFQAQKSTEFSA